MAPADGSAQVDSAPRPQAERANSTKGADMKQGTAKFKSTWHSPDYKGRWGIGEWFFHLTDIDPIPPNFEAPVKEMTDKMPYVREYDMHRWLIPRAIIPIVAQWALKKYADITFHPIVAFFVYSLWIKAVGIMLFHLLRYISAKVGFLDAKHPRDGVPDGAVGKVFTSLVSTSTYRPMIATMLAYDRNAPVGLSFPGIFLYLGLYAVVLDFYFYFYHRAMHEIPWLWHLHKTHHLTRHPNPTLTLFADEIQEIGDMVLVPFLAYMSMRQFTNFNFYDWYFCGLYVIFTELSGHCGVRFYATSPTTFGLLQKLGLEIVIEDHDVHHRHGWRDSGNYGKQSRVWDNLFGTTLDRIETIPNNMEKEAIPLPWFLI